MSMSILISKKINKKAEFTCIQTDGVAVSNGRCCTEMPDEQPDEMDDISSEVHNSILHSQSACCILIEKYNSPIVFRTG